MMGLFGGSSSKSSTTYNQNSAQAGDSSTLATGSGNNVASINTAGGTALNLSGANVSAPVTVSDLGAIQGALSLAQRVADQSTQAAQSIASQAFGASSQAASALADQASGGANQNQRTLVLLAIAVVAGVVLLQFAKGRG